MGLDYCVEENMDDDQAAEEMDVQEYLECRELGLEDYYGVYDDNGDAVQLFAGPKCASDGNGIHLAIYLEETCSMEAGSDAYTAYKKGYRQALPYQSESLVNANKCVSCLARNDDDNYVYSKSSAAPAIAWIFAFSTIGLAAYVYTLHNKREIQLADSNGQLA